MNLGRLSYFLLLYIVFFAYAANLTAQQYNFSRFTSKDGLAQNQCRTIATDSLGYLWIGTFEGGISRFNGHKFITYSKKNKIGSNFIFKVMPDTENRMWFATENGIISIFGKNIEHYEAGETSKIKIEALTIDREDKVWFGHPEKGVGIIEDGETSYPPLDFKGENELIRIFCDSKNRIWFSTLGHGLFLLEENELAKIELSDSALQYENILSFAEDSTGFLLGTTNGLYKLSEDFSQCELFHPQLKDRTITSIFKDSKSRLWIGTLYGAAYLENNQATFLDSKNGLTEYIYDITEDFEGGIWFSTNRGIFRLNNDFLLTYNKEFGLKDNLVWSVAQDTAGRIWLSTESGIDIINQHRNVPKPVLPKALTYWASPVVSDDQGNVFIGSVSSIFKFDGQRFTKMSLSNQEEETYFTSSLVRKNGDILFAGTNGVYHIKNKRLEHLVAPESLENHKVNSIIEDNNGRVWLGTEGGGIFITEKEAISKEAFGKLTHLDIANGKLVNDVVNVLYKDHKGHVWMGTSGNGLFKFPLGNFSKKPVSYEDAELSSSNVYSIIEDNEGNIWAGTDQGLNKLCIIQNDFVNVKIYGEQEGFHPLEVCHNSVTKDKQGHLWFGTVEGVVSVDPSQDAYSASLPRVRMDGIQVFFQDVAWEEFSEQIDTYTGLPINSVAELPNEENHLVFFFSGIDYTIPSKVRYQWKLEGLDREWTPPSSINEAIYPNIPPGKYTLKIKAINAAGISMEEPYTFSFEITKPFYQTRAFMLFAIVLCFVLAYFYYKNRVNNLKQYQQRLEFKVRQRTKEIEEQNEKMRAQSKKLSTALSEIDKKNQELIKAYKNQQNSLAYASKIQNAVMFAENNLEKSLPDAFIFSQPKELVSSDFYWAKEYEDHIFVILVDCTGHGVPGAFLSMIGFEYLTEIVELMNVHDPAKILTLLNRKISTALSQSQDKELVDGMDVAICRINKLNNTLTFSGARRPLHYIENGEIHVIKGHFSGAGINLQDQEPDFRNVHINLMPDTKVFLFSDGYPNQFNKKGEKFKISNFKKLLFEIADMENEAEKVAKLSLALNDWIQGGEQLDDVLVIGFSYYNVNLSKKSAKSPARLKKAE